MEIRHEVKVFALIARRTMRYCRSQDYLQHLPRHFPARVHFCLYWRPAI